VVLLCFTIGLEKKLDIKEILTDFNQNKIFYSVCHTKNNTFIKTFLDKEEIIKQISKTFSKYILKNYVKPFILLYLSNYYDSISENQKDEILSDILSESEDEYLSKKVYGYIKNEHSLIVKGYVDFRLKDYFLSISERIDIILEDMAIKNEYYEFIGYLKYFVNMHMSKYKEINVVKYLSGSYELYDENKKIINNNTKNEFMFEFADENFCINDVLINDLINFCPQKVIIHNKENFETKEILNTVEHIFDKKTFYCTGCDLCKE